MSRSVYKNIVLFLFLLFVISFLESSEAKAQVSECVGGYTLTESMQPVNSVASAELCPADTCYFEDKQSNCLDAEGRCSVFRCYKLQKSPDEVGTCEIDKAATIDASGIPVIKTNSCVKPYKPAWKGGFECGCVSEGNPNIVPDSLYSKNTSQVSGGGIVCDPSNGQIVKNLPNKQEIANKIGGGGIGDFIKDFGINSLKRGNPVNAGVDTLTEQKKKGDELRKQVDDEYRSQVAALPKGVMTAIGCVPTEPKPFVVGMFKFISLGAGGIAFLLMILGALQMITAEGNPENIKNAQEKFYSAIIGLLFIIFAVLLLQVIGYDILGLPGFGR